VGDLEKRHATTLLIPFTAVIRGPYLERIDQDEARRYLAGVRDLAAEAVASADPRVIICALRVLELAPASIRRIRKPLARKLQREGYAAPQTQASTMIDLGGYYHFKHHGSC
jgi:hypothetical protein